jgi:HTH-type transcriptional regulator, competence development regulator
MANDPGLEDETFGRRIQRLRREAQVTQRDLAKQLEIDFTYLSKLENDRGETPSEETVRKIARLLHTDEEELLARAGKVPGDLRDRAQQDLQFARFLRHLPHVPDEDLQKVYRQLKITPPKR